MYVELMKNVFLADSSELMDVRLIFASWAKKVWFLLYRHHLRQIHEKHFSRRYERAIGCFTHFGFLSPKTFDSYFIDIMYVEFIRKFFQADSSKLMGVRLISASWAQKCFVNTLQTSCTSNWWKMFFSRIRANWWVLDSFSPAEPKNVWFLLSRHHLRQIHEKHFSHRYERAIGCFTHFGFLSPKTFDSYFIDIMYVEFIRKFLQADSSKLMSVRLISASWAQKRFIPTF